MSRRLERAREILRTEGEAVGYAAQRLDENFDQLVDRILHLQGKVVLTGVGKSGLIAQKIAATLASTGTPALFLHSVEAVMGDLGILSPDDLLIPISNSGETIEVINVVIAASRIGTPAVALTQNPESTLARQCAALLPIPVDGEACPLGLAPTTSTTVTLALGDALALVLMEEKSFTAKQFEAFHPGGSLGQRLALKVSDIMRTGEELPVVSQQESLRRGLQEMTRKGWGVTLVSDSGGRLSGIVTDGDVRRILESGITTDDLSQRPIEEFMTPAPKTVEADASASEALRMMEVRSITSLAIIDTRSRPMGILLIHDILGRAKFMV
ncbi:MAG: KpsF/GutQ family sugar-phosphate isomerase [Planctomycetota bacterium]